MLKLGDSSEVCA
jgi:hypothetical protein